MFQPVPQTAGTIWDEFTVEVRDSYNNLCTNDNTTLVTVVTVTGTAGFVSGITATASSGVATFASALYNKAEEITIQGTAYALTSTSASITIGPAPPAQLAFINLSGTVPAPRSPLFNCTAGHFALILPLRCCEGSEDTISQIRPAQREGLNYIINTPHGIRCCFPFREADGS